MTSYDTLVIILSIMLAIFLLLSIIVLVYAIQVMKHVKRISEKAESVMDSVESAGKVFKRAAGPVTVSRVIANIIDSFTDRREERRSGKK